MLFNSLEFAVFFPVVTILYFLIPYRFRGLLLLAASCYFYMVFIPQYILILVFTITVDYFAGLIISRSSGSTRKFWLVASICANVGVLAFFKYFNFLNDSLRSLVEVFHLGYPIPYLRIILPIGLSFHTFQSMSYTIEVYRRAQAAERSFFRFALYVLFYPQLVAGPIERPNNLLHQFREHHDFDYDRARAGLQLMAWGLFKKVAVADQLSLIVMAVYTNPDAYSGLAILGATYCFAIQIYTDFSGYSDMAIGAAQVMGFKLMTNFDHPYFSETISEFWRRWHISLSTWFRDYLYIPMGGSRVAVDRRILNVLITFGLSGLWHGANWTYVIWGLLNGAYLVASILTADLRARLMSFFRVPGGFFIHRLIRTLITFHLIVLTWFFFRAPSIQSAFSMIGAVVTLRHGRAMQFPDGKFILLFTVLVLFATEAVQTKVKLRNLIAAQRTVARWTVYVAGILLLGLLSDFTRERLFIYFQF